MSIFEQKPAERPPGFAPKKPPAKDEAPPPVKDQAKALKELNEAYALASDNASEPKVQEHFREKFRDYRDEYLKPAK